MLKRMHDEADEEQRIRLARWSRRSLATVAGAAPGAAGGSPAAHPVRELQPRREQRLAAGSAPQQRCPGGLPASCRAFPAGTAGGQLHYDAGQPAGGSALPGAKERGEPAIELPTPLPAEPARAVRRRAEGTWHVVGADDRVALPAAIAERVVLTTIDGRRYELRAELPEVVPAPARTTPCTPLTSAISPKTAKQASDRRLAGKARDRAATDRRGRDEASTGTGAEASQGDRGACCACGHPRPAPVGRKDRQRGPARPTRTACCASEALAAPPPG
jgi:hypothetical protein